VPENAGQLVVRILVTLEANHSNNSLFIPNVLGTLKDAVLLIKASRQEEQDAVIAEDIALHRKLNEATRRMASPSIAFTTSSFLQVVSHTD
jgi:hypothetical protein